MSNKKQKSGYSPAVRITCIVLAALTLLGVAGTLIYVISSL